MDIKKLVAEYGAINLRFFIPMSPPVSVDPGLAFRDYSNDRVPVECVISEDRYTVADGYKIRLVAKDRAYGSESYYQSDLGALLRECNGYRAYVLTVDGYHAIDKNYT
jgi:hypothetical protein